MSEVRNIVCVIPARAGSKGIPSKNTVDFCGKPLITWSIRAALESNVVDRVLVSTDCEKIAAISRDAGAEVPFLRPKELAEDNVHAVHVIIHAMNWVMAHDGRRLEGIMMLLPTSPLRQPSDIAGSVELFRAEHASAVISVEDLGKYPTNLRFLANQKLQMVFPDENKNAQRQGLDKLYGVNGSIFLARPNLLQAAGTFHVSGALGYVMEQIRSIDINEPKDLELAKKFQKLVVLEKSFEEKC